MFENMSSVLTGVEPKAMKDGLTNKSIDSLLANKELFMCLVCPTIGFVIYVTLQKQLNQSVQSSKRTRTSKKEERPQEQPSEYRP